MKNESITQHIIKSSKDWQNLLVQFPHNYQNRQPITAAVEITDRGTAIRVNGLHKAPSASEIDKPKISDHIQIEAGRTDECKVNHSADLEVLKPMLITLAKEAKSRIEDITIVFKTPGFETSSNTNQATKFDQIPAPGHIYCANANDGKGLDWDALGFIEDIAKQADISLDLEYMNEGDLGLISQFEDEIIKGSSSKLRVSVLNDAVAVAKSAKRYLLNNKEAVLALIYDDGINFGVYRAGDQQYPRNEEIGQELLPKPDGKDMFKFQSPLDLIYARTREGSKDLTIEETFAGGALSRAYKMLIKMLQTPNILESMKIPVLDHLNQFIPKSCRLDIRNIDGSNQLVVISKGANDTEEVTPIALDGNMDNDTILAKAKEVSTLEQALVVSLAKRLGNTIITRFKDLLISPETKIFARTDSPLLSGILSVPGAYRALIETIQSFRTVQHELPKLKRLKQSSKNMNGLLYVLNDMIAGI